ncbi:MAG: DNA repair protein RecO [Caldilineaceae bacterium]|nr:DNA repair protein RecO [Caldilineaceae bacterium]
MTTRERVRTTHALILRRRDVHDADRLLTVLTPRDGKQELLAKGARKTMSRKAGHLELFTHAALVVAQGRTWDIVTEAQTIESFRHLRQELHAIGAASYVCELVDCFSESDDDNQPVWDLALAVLRELDAAAQQPAETVPPNLLRWFDLQLLSLAGFQPQLFACVACETALEPALNFVSLAAGGVFCPRCAAHRDDVEPLDADTLKVLRFMQSHPWPEVSRVNVRPPILRRVESLLQRYLIIVLERHLKSADFLRRLQHLAPSTTTPPPAPATPS